MVHLEPGLALVEGSGTRGTILDCFFSPANLRFMEYNHPAVIAAAADDDLDEEGGAPRGCAKNRCTLKGCSWARVAHRRCSNKCTSLHASGASPLGACYTAGSPADGVQIRLRVAFEPLLVVLPLFIHVPRHLAFGCPWRPTFFVAPAAYHVLRKELCTLFLRP